MSGWGGRRVMTLRRRWQQAIDAGLVGCARCGGEILPEHKWDLDHLQPRTLGGATWDPSNLAPSHAYCNRLAGQRYTAALRKARAQAARQRRAPPGDPPAVW